AIETYGEPKVPADLATRPCIIDTNYRFKQNWAFQVDGERHSVTVKGPIEVNSASAAREAALCHLGYLRAPLFFVYNDINKGDLNILLEPFEEPERGIYAVYPHRRHLSAKVRAFVDYLVEWSSKHPIC
ncbi:MAG: substrate binding domain-containing protein, partial [Roseibium sp.]|uniref:substrate binding domain-containing protein n=1 Tax=Roseibium sp. TaxID=1936156 RepID=UPI0026115405